MRTSAMVSFLALALVACRDSKPAPTGEVLAEAESRRVLESTPWLDSAPQDERDIIKAYVFQDGEGLYFVGNSYKATFEALRYWVEDSALKLRFLDEDKTYKTTWKIERWSGEVFDYKLTLKKDPRGPQVYYGFESRREVPAVVSKIKALAGQP